MATVFHATKARFIDSITENGVWANSVGRKAFFCMDWQDSITTLEKWVLAKDAAIVEIDVPEDVFNQHKLDNIHDQDFGTQSAAYLEQDLSPEWIKSVYYFSRDTREHPVNYEMEGLRLT